MKLFAESKFSVELLEKSVRQFILKNLGPDVDIIVNKRIFEQRFDDDKVTAKCRADIKKLRGISTVAVVFSSGETEIKQVNIPVKITIYKNVAVATRQIQAGSLISSNDVQIQKMDVTQYATEDLPDIKELIGKELKRSIPQGWIVSRDALKKQNIIKRGDKVTISVLQGAVRIRTTGFAMQDASEGETLKIKREGSILQGTVAMDGTIYISGN